MKVGRTTRGLAAIASVQDTMRQTLRVWEKRNLKKLVGVERLDQVDRWIAAQNDRTIDRPEAIRRLLKLGLTVKIEGRITSGDTKRRARQMAGNTIDTMGDVSATSADQADRKERLLEGPEEFQKGRRDRDRKSGK